MSTIAVRRSAVRRHSARLAGFALLPALSMLAPLVLLPLVSARFGAAGWGSLAIGQSVGAVASFVLGMTWPITGGHLVAGADDVTRRSVFRLSMATRACLLVLLLPLGAALTIPLAPGYPLEATLFMAAVTLNGFTAAWYFAGVGTPRAVVVNEGLLRFAGYIIAVAGLLAGAGLWWYGVSMLATGVAMAAANTHSVLGRGGAPLPPLRWRRIRAELLHQARPTLSRGLQSLFYYGGVTVVALVAPVALPLFAAADQVQKAANNGLSALPMAFVHWVGVGDEAESGRRSRRALGVVVAMAGLTVAAWLVLGQRVAAVLFAGRVDLGPVLVWLVGLVILVFVLSRSVELLLLIPAGLERTVWRSNRIASPLGLALIAIGAILGGVEGALLGTLAAEVGALAYYLIDFRIARPARAARTAA